MYYTRTVFMLLFFVFVSTSFAQKSIDATLSKFNTESVPYISIGELSKSEGVLLLDTRKKEEFEVSHLKNAIWVGYEAFSLDSVVNKIENRGKPLVVYCSIGVRSEEIGERLMAAGFTDVKNLYGGIFEWKNQGNPVFDPQGDRTNKVHAFDRQWGKLLKNADKIYPQPKNRKKE
ncbi:MAG: rhodanese-like domain-containing protein [Flavobacteriaceae bacterium]